MSNLGVKRQLVLLAILDEDVFRLVPFLGREDVVRLSSRNRNRTVNSSELTSVHKAGMGQVAGVNAVIPMTNKILHK